MCIWTLTRSLDCFSATTLVKRFGKFQCFVVLSNITAVANT